MFVLKVYILHVLPKINGHFKSLQILVRSSLKTALSYSLDDASKRYSPDTEQPSPDDCMLKTFATIISKLN